MKARGTSLQLPRRAFLAGVGSLSALPLACDAEDAYDGELWISAQGDDDDSYGIVLAQADGGATKLRSGFRGHGLTHHPDRPHEVVMFGRRPGEFAIVVDLARREITQRMRCAPDRRLAGHGCFNTDASLLLTVEADVDTAAGMIAVRDADSLERLREIDTYGIEPHEMALMPDGKTLVIANGGLLTRPETGAEVLNLDTMESSLVYVDLDSGTLLAEERVAEPKASIRHLAVGADGTVVTVMQIQRDALTDTDPRPLIAVQRPGQALAVLDDGLDLAIAMQDYAGGVAFDHRTRTAAVTSPRGNLVGFWHVDTGKLLGHLSVADVSGVAVSPDGPHFVLSGANGQVRVVETGTLHELRDAEQDFTAVLWDNHLLAIHT